MKINVQITPPPGNVLKPILNAVKSPALAEQIGRRVTRLVKDHFRGLPPNKQGFSTTGFWARAAEATEYWASAGRVQITVNQVGVRQRYLGGPIDPIHGRYLTIPAIAETYGHVAADFGDLKMVWARSPYSPGNGLGPGLAPVDVVPDRNGRVNPDSVYFWLLAHVSQDENPDVLPSDEDLGAAISEAVDGYFARLNSSGGNN